MSKENVKDREYELQQEDLEEVMRKYDRESNVRVWTGKPALVVKAVLIGFSLFCIWVTLFATFLEEIRLTSFMGLVILLGFLMYPAKKGEQKANYIPWYDIIGMVLGTGAFLYYTFSAEQIIQQGTRFSVTSRGDPPKCRLAHPDRGAVLHRICDRLWPDKPFHRRKTSLSGSKSLLCKDRYFVDADQCVFQIYRCIYHIRCLP